jgi:hypothetical protein
MALIVSDVDIARPPDEVFAYATDPSTSEITEISPPSVWAIHGVDGPIRADVSVTVESRGDGGQSHVTLKLDFLGHGMGKMILPAVVRQARKEVPESCQKLKQRLESSPGGG